MRPIYHSLWYMKEGVYQVRLNCGITGLVDRNGRWLYKTESNISILPFDFFQSGKVAASEDGRWGILINPLLYGDWAETELERASFIGFPDARGDNITVAQLAELVATVGAFRQELCERGVIPSKANIYVSALDLLSVYQVNPEKLATRADVAYLFYTLANKQHEITGHYLSSYKDITTVSEEMRAAIAYITAISVISCESEEHFEPHQTVTDVEVAEMSVRFVEKTLDPLGREDESDGMLNITAIN